MKRLYLFAILVSQGLNVSENHYWVTVGKSSGGLAWAWKLTGEMVKVCRGQNDGH